MVLHVDPAGMQAAEQRLTGLSGDSKGIADLAKDADPEWYTWGLPGLAFAQWYGAFAPEIHQHLGDLSEALGAHSDRIKFCRESYATKEEDNIGIMNKIKSRLDGK
ncbi:WXG100 family type VII secretion target [Phytomonospora endophytica]|uniref:Excreted virulence factor EspC (Type VII ESX diderm) n=1 Tax=Phytomonospora endophytica TaxID=714109 RepID=A0A841F9D0_9ACTN|nr:hypothetical protein [Phytomonospora endophytica]MBB6032856.1 hypothetical protein [Phytomonospora endophytica]GIG65082.1 hypothetical protein Pen01_13770 [Phytomonospora endophytica]